MCRATGLIIANGRCGSDKSIGNLTCDNASIIYYVLCSPELLVDITDFNVLPFCNMYSDKHSPINLAFDTHTHSIVLENEEKGNSIKYNKYEVVRWDNNKKDNFIDSIDINKVTMIENVLDDVILNNDVSQNSIDNIVSEICNIFHSSAIQCNIKWDERRYKKRKRLLDAKPWFNDRCEQKRKAFFCS